MRQPTSASGCTARLVATLLACAALSGCGSSGAGGGGAGVTAPMLVQHVASSTNPPGQGIAGNRFRFTLPNAVGAGNCLVLGVSHAYDPSRTVSIADDRGNPWPATPAVTRTSSSGDLTSSIFVLAKAAPGTTTITITFDAAVQPFRYTISELAGIATAAPVSGTSSAEATAPAITAGTFTPANNDSAGGNAVWSMFTDVGAGTAHAATGFAASAAQTLLNADIAWGAQGLPNAAQYGVQVTQAAVTPEMTVTMSGGADAFLGVAVALRAAPAGTAPPPGIRIVRVLHHTSAAPPPAWTLQFPSTGNLLVAITANGRNLTDIGSADDTKGNAWRLTEPDDTEPQIWWAANASPGADLRVTFHIAGGSPTATMILYDVAGAAASPFDVAAGRTGFEDVNGANVANAPVITPTTANGLTLAAISCGQGPSLGLDAGSPAGAVFDLVTYDGEIDLDLMENADGQAHLYNATTATETWNWIISNGGQTMTVAGTAVHFHGAGGG